MSLTAAAIPATIAPHIGNMSHEASDYFGWQSLYEKRIWRIAGNGDGTGKLLIIQVCKKMKLGQCLEKIASDLVEEISVIEPIYRAAEKSAPEYDPKSVLESLGRKI